MSKRPTYADLEERVLELEKTASQRKLALEALRESEKRFETVAEQSPNMIFINKKGRIVYANSLAGESMGYRRDELYSPDFEFRSLIAPESLELVASSFKKHLDGKEVEPYEYTLINREGRRIEAVISTKLIDYEGEKAILGIVTDITERKRAEQALRESEDRYRMVSELTSDYAYAYAVDTDDGISNIWVTGALQRITGFTRQEVRRRGGWESLIHPDDLPIPHQQLQSLLANKSQTVEYRILTKSKEIRWMRDFARPVWDEEKNRLTRICGAVQDITGQKRAEQALRESQEKYQQLFENAPAGIYEIDIQSGRFSNVNDLMCQYTGYSKEEFLALNPLDILDEESRNRQLERMRRSLAGETIPDTVEYKIRGKHGQEYWVNLTTRVHYEQGIPARATVVAHDISERKRAEEALVKSEKRFRELAELLPETVFETDMSGNLTFVNRVAYEKFGYREDDLAGGLNTFHMIVPEDRQRALRNAEKVMQGEMLQLNEYEALRKDGTRFPIILHASAIQEHGKPQGMRGLLIDITERKHAESELRGERERFLALVQNSPFGMLMIDRAGKYVYVNPKFIEIFGYTLEDVPDGRSWFKKAYPDPEYRRHVIDIWLSDLEKAKPGEQRPRTFTVQCKDGRKKIVDFIPVQLASEDQLVVCVDITDRKLGEEALRASEGRYRKLVEAASHAKQGIVVLQARESSEGIIVFANEEAERITGYPKDRLAGMSWFDLVTPKDQSDAKSRYRRRLTGENLPGLFEISLLTGNDEEVAVEVNASVTDIEGVIGLVVFFRDVRLRKETEREMERLHAQFLQAQKMEAVGRLAGGVAHDFNNMLQTVLGYSELALNEAKAGSFLRESLLEIRKVAERSARLTRQLLAFARKQTVRPEVLHLNDTIASMLKMLQRLIGENINLAWVPGHGLWKVKIDPSQVDQILANLVVNSRDAIVQVGRVTIETTNAELDEVFCAAHAGAVPGKYVRLTVSDDGCGMDRETLESIFEPFFTTKKAGEGTGLGLATVYGIVKQNEGFIHVSSEPGEGATFWIYLPRFSGEGAGAAREEASEVVTGGTETVLIVEDDGAILRLGKRILEALGYTVLAGRTPSEALELAKQHEGEIHLLITDVVMPEMNGRELAERLAEVRPDIKCLYMSGYTADVIAQRGVLDEGVEFMSKPFSRADLAAKVRGVLER